MSERVERLVAEITEYLEATEGSNKADQETLIEATEKIALILGDAGLTPGDVITLRSGVVYTEEPAYFFENDQANEGRLFCRNWRSLEPVVDVISDQDGHRLMAGTVDLPMAWDEKPRESATIEDRLAFLKELPELASRLKQMALTKRDPKLGRSAQLAARLADLIEKDVQGLG